MPILNDLTVNLMNKTFSFSFKRPPKTISGTSLKSRSRNGHLSSSLPEHGFNRKNLSFYDMTIDDLGVNVSLAVQQKYAENNLYFMLEADVVGNTRFVENLLSSCV